MDSDPEFDNRLEYELDCTHCGGPNFPISAIGHVVHYSCMWCGIWYSVKNIWHSVKNEEEEIGEFQQNG